MSPFATGRARHRPGGGPRERPPLRPRRRVLPNPSQAPYHPRVPYGPARRTWIVNSGVRAALVGSSSLRSFLVLSSNDNMGGSKNSLEGYPPQAAFFSCAPRALPATITARVISCREAFVG